ncbi:MAG: glycosyltransferase [Ruminococcaceae bacterium]|nr:glycosyltransferase [Oscillospiraceae bacterium]
MSLISVIVPVYNVEKYINRCVDSILAQTFMDFELILIDDGSHDNSPYICDEYAEKDSRIRVIHQENSGVSSARNAGLNLAINNSDSEWITFIDSDDWVDSRYLEKLIKATSDHDVMISCCNYCNVVDDTICCDNNKAIDVCTPEDLYINKNLMATVPWGKLYLKKCFNGIKYPEGKIHEDEYITHTILFTVKKVVFLNEQLYYYFVNKDGITKSKWTPVRLQSLDAMIQQVKYMKEHKYQKAYRHALVKYVLCHTNIIYRIKEEKNIKYYKYIPRLRIKAKYMLIRYHKLLPIEKYPGAYDKAFPVFMYFYWIIKAQINKLMK